MATNITLNIVATDRASYRKQLIEEFLKEQPVRLSRLLNIIILWKHCKIINTFI